MNRRGVVILAGIILLLTIIIALNWGSSPATNTAPAAQLMFPALKESLTLVQRLTLKSQQGETTLVKTDAGWVVTNRADYPADFELLGQLMTTLSEARLIEKKTARGENFARLGLDDKTAISLKVQAGELELSVLVGMAASGREGQFVRFESDPQTWLSDKKLDLEVNPAEWLATEVTGIASDRIARVQFLPFDGAAFAVSRDGESANFELEQIPEGRTLKFDGVANSLGTALDNVRLIDVSERSDEPWQMADVVVFTLTSGLEIRVEARVEARVEPSVEGLEEDDVHGLRFFLMSPLAENTLAVADYEDLRWLMDWQFEVASYTHGNFAKTVDDLLDEIETETASE